MNEVRIYNPEGTLVRVISKKEVTKLHWDKFVKGRQQGGGNVEETTKTRTCRYCNKKFPATRGRTYKFCSAECRTKGTSKKPKTEKACIECGNLFLPKYSNMLYCHAPCVRKGKR